MNITFLIDGSCHETIFGHLSTYLLTIKIVIVYCAGTRAPWTWIVLSSDAWFAARSLRTDYAYVQFGRGVHFQSRRRRFGVLRHRITSTISGISMQFDLSINNLNIKPLMHKVTWNFFFTYFLLTELDIFIWPGYY